MGRPQRKRGASVVDYLAFGYLGAIIGQLLFAYVEGSDARPPLLASLLFVSIVLSLTGPHRQSALPEDRWHIERKRLQPFLWTVRSLAGASALAGIAILAWMLISLQASVLALQLGVGLLLFGWVIAKFGPELAFPSRRLW